MGVSLTKGGNVSLTTQASGSLGSVTVGLGWDARTTTGDGFDLDASALLCQVDGKVRTDGDFVFYGNLTAAEGAVRHLGDNLTGDSDGDDEQLTIDLTAVPAEIDKVVFNVSIYDAATRRQSFGQVHNAFIRVVDDADGLELARFDLTQDASSETAMLFGELYRAGTEWKFRAVGQGYRSGLKGIATDFGVSIA